MNTRNFCLSILFGILAAGSVQGFDENTDYHWEKINKGVLIEILDSVRDKVVDQCAWAVRLGQVALQ